LRDQAKALQSRDVSVVELVEHYLERIERFNPVLNALVHVDSKVALERAERLSDTVAAPDATLLTGLPSADKDLVARAGMPTGYGSRLTSTGERSDESDPMALWLDRVGVISVGKTSTSEFGMAAATEALVCGPTKNPHDHNRSAGGSSGGAASAVASGMLPFAPGSDGGGSIRIPALSCGLVGWKPSRGLVPAGSGFEFLGGLAVPGLITKSVDDLGVAADLLVTGQWNWATQAPGEPGGYATAIAHPPRRLRIGVTRSSPWPADWDITLQPEGETALSLAVDALGDAGHEVIEWDWEPAPSYADDFVALWTANAASLPVPDEQLELVEPLTRYLIERGRQLPAVDLVDALAGLRRFEHTTISQFGQFDAVLTPGLSDVAPELGWYDPEDAWRNFRQQVAITPWTSFVNVAGLPAVSVPTHYSEDLPLGVQLIGQPGADSVVMGLANDIEARLPGATRVPAGY